MNYTNYIQNVESVFAHIEGEETIRYRDKIINGANNAIDVLTYSRIHAIGFENLTAFQQRIVGECAAEIAAFLLENREILDSPLSAYSINGVSMQFKFNQTVHCSNGVVVPETTYRKLMSTNLCYGGL